MEDELAIGNNDVILRSEGGGGGLPVVRPWRPRSVSVLLVGGRRHLAQFLPLSAVEQLVLV